MIILLILCLIIIGILGYQLYQKKQVDNGLLESYQNQLEETKQQLDFDKRTLECYRTELLDVQIKTNTEKQQLRSMREQAKECEQRMNEAQREYEDIIEIKTTKLNQIMEDQQQRRQESLDETFKEKKAAMESELDTLLKQYDQQAEEASAIAAKLIEEASNRVKEYQLAEEQQKARFESLRKPLLQYEMDKQAKLFYTIQLPEEYRDDIEFLLTTVAAKVQHPDIISKLVWAEYVKPYLDDTFKRIEIKAEPGIYKLTNLDSGKAYIGKSTDIKKRIADHFKSSIGIKSIADQAVHHEILKTGFWNWSIEAITYCDKEKLSELEKYYIEFFDTQTFGYNRNAGG